MTASWSCVGGTTTTAEPLNETSPTLNASGSPATNAAADSRAALMRSGADVGRLHGDGGVERDDDRGPLARHLHVGLRDARRP
jgi:hypothetical protein